MFLILLDILQFYLECGMKDLSEMKDMEFTIMVLADIQQSSM